MVKVDKKMVQAAVTVICVIGLILLLLGSFDDTPSPSADTQVKGRYSFSAEQKASSPAATCQGFLELNAEGRPTRLSFALSTKGRQRGKYNYAIGIGCYVDPDSGASVYKDLRPMRGTDASHFTTLRVSPDGKMFMIRLENPPAPWNLVHDHLSINAKNAQGSKDWKVLPPIRKCRRQTHYSSRLGDTVTSVDRRFGIGRHQLEKANPTLVNPDVLRPGTRLRVPAPVPVPTTYVVKKGDTLNNIDAKYRLNMHKVLSQNPEIREPTNIYPGESLYLR